jgi:TonB family protein
MVGLVLMMGCATATPPPMPTPVPPMPQPEAAKPADPSRLTEEQEVEREDLAQFVRSQADSLRACYVEQLAKSPNLRGTVVVLFNVSPAGTATDVTVESDSFPSNEVAMCITHVVRQWVFPFRPSEPLPVAYPFVFSPAP